MSLEAALAEADAAEARDQLCYKEIAEMLEADLSRRKLNPQQESELCEYIEELSDQGLPPTRQMIQNFASELAHEDVGDAWVSRFILCYRDTLLYKWSSAMDAQRHRADSPEKYKQYFDLLHSKITKYSIEARHTYNMDEKGFAIRLLNKSKRVFSKASWKAKKKRSNLQDGSREWVTVIAAICADGSTLSPSVIFAGMENVLRANWVDAVEAGKHSVFITATPSGWSNDEVGLAWLKQVFQRETEQKTRNSWRLLIIDGHGSHITRSFIDYCNLHRILLLIYPPHSTHTLQPLDVVCFAPLSNNYSKASTQLIHDTQGLVGIQKSDFFNLFNEAWCKTFTENLVLTAFEATGIWLPNAAIILDRFESPERESPHTPSPPCEDSWQQLETLYKQSLENKGFRRQISKRGTSKKKQVKLPLQPTRTYYSEAVFWSPQKIQAARDQLKENHCKQLEEAAQKARDKQEKAEKKLRDEQEKQARRVERERARDAAKLVQPASATKLKAPKKRLTKLVPKKQRGGRVVGSRVVAVPPQAPEPKLNRIGRKVALPRKSCCQIPRPKVCYYYCRDDETGQAVSILSGLILALLEQLSGLKKMFYEWYRRNQASGALDPATSASKLAEFMELVLESFDRLLFVVIDGLDECERTSRRTLLQVLGRMTKKTPRLKIILSSRPEEEILEQLDQTPRIVMETKVDRDSIIVRHTVQEQLFYLHENVRTLVIETLSRSAQGSAIWIKMTVELIQVRRIKALAPMRLFLKQMSLPEQLSELYTTLLSRNSSNDLENKELATIALTILAAAGRPLSIHELAWATALAAAQHDIETVAALAQLVDHQRVMSLIYPFIARVDFADLRKRQLRLVHQSVKEFIVRDWLYLKGINTSTASNQAIAPRIESLEAFMLDICVEYLLLQEVGNIPLFSEEQIAIDELPQEVDLFSDQKSFEYDVTWTWEVWEEDMICYDPTERGFGEFFVYASSYWLKHFGATERGPFPRLAKLERLCQIGSMRLNNWVNQNCRPSCAIKARFDFDSRLYDPLSIISLYGSDAVLRDMLRNSDFDKDKYFSSPAASAADQILQWGDLSKLRIVFLEGKLCSQLRNLEFFQLLIKRWFDFGSRHENWAGVFDLIDNVLDALVTEQWGNELLCIAARAGCLPMIQRLLDRAYYMEALKTELWRDSRPISEAVLGNHADAVELLLGAVGLEVDLQSPNFLGESLLHTASVHCNTAIFRLLVPRVQSTIHQIDNVGETALMRVVRSGPSSEGRYEAARMLLLNAKTDWSTHNVSGQQRALQLAVQLGDAEMCRILRYEDRPEAMPTFTHGHDGQLVTKNSREALGE
ncbi:hypothetical protein OPT61_g3749 [Boeremia exigua]|uniref:Uncharacterized protein n=1 Tax=Boeremia exigua TaxID=749465 RepID=A0ACC2IGW7_9PLEO|nr:hypothetical protein OPT61_g3749 [Boeremia exigua]